MGYIYVMFLKTVLKTIHVCLQVMNNMIYVIFILDVVHDATENYFERGKLGCRNFHVTKTPLFMMKVFKLFSFYLSMLVTLCFHDLFVYKFRRHRKWVRLKCVSHFLLDALFLLQLLFSCDSIFYNLQAQLMALKKRFREAARNEFRFLFLLLFCSQWS